MQLNFNIQHSTFNIQHFLIVAIFLFSNITTNAQCAMCRAAIESEGNTTKAAAVNDGIVYLMVIPYVLVGGIGYAVYRMNRTKKV